MSVSGGMMKMESEMINPRDFRLQECNVKVQEKMVESITDLFTVAKLSGYNLEIWKLYRDMVEKKHTCHIHIDLLKNNEKHLIRLHVKDGEMVKMFYKGNQKDEWDKYFEDFVGETVEDDRGKITIHEVYKERMILLFQRIKEYI